jgi:membrane associated rhomboid family serine protease
MTDAGLNPLENVLRLCADAAPGPWYPAVYVNATGARPDAIEEALHKLWLEGLLRKAGGSPETGVGFVVSPAGQRLLADGAALQRLRDGRPLWPDDPGSVVRHSLLRPTRPVVCRLLLLANVLVFAYGWQLASGLGIASDFLTGFTKDAAKLLSVLHRSGSVEGLDLLNGEWWRLLTACFAHGSLLHLGMNMYALFAIGAFAEQTWGRLRFLTIYLLAGWGGSCLAMAYSPGRPVVGASGALCGLLGAVAVWVLFNAKHLPANHGRRVWRAVVINTLLIAFLSLFPGVSGWGHLGGALTGAAAAVALHLQRFGSPALRWLAPLALLPLPGLGVLLIDRARASSPAWEKVVEEHERLLEERRGDEERERRQEQKRRAAEKRKRDEGEERDFQERFLTRNKPTSVSAVVAAADQVYQGIVPDPLELNPGDLDPAEAKKAQRALDEQHRLVRALVAALEEAGPYQDEAVEEARQTARDYARAEAELLAQAGRCLGAGKKCTPHDLERLRAQDKKVQDLRRRWTNLLD